MWRSWILVLWGITGLVAASPKRIVVYVGSGGCDTDDPTCHLPPATQLGWYSLGESGELHLKGSVKELSATWVEQSRDGRYLWVANSIGNVTAPGTLAAYRIDKATGDLTLLNHVTSGSGTPVYIELDSTGRYLLVANYMGGAVSVVPVLPNGYLGDKPSCVIQHHGHGPNPDRQTSPHPHCIRQDPSDPTWVYNADLGLDRLFVYRFDSHHGTLTPGTPPWVEMTPGTGPRHIAFHPTRPYMYLVQELANTLAVFSRSNGVFTFIGNVSTVPASQTVFSKVAEVAVVGKAGGALHVLVSNRSPTPSANTLVTYSIGPTGMVTEVHRHSSGGTFPRGFHVQRDGVEGGKALVLAGGQDTDNVAALWLDAQGGLSFTGANTTAPTPVCFSVLHLQ